jgi:Bacterial membrane protein YfhO
MLWYGAQWKKQLIHSGVVLALFALLYTIVFFPRIIDGSSNLSGDVFAYYLPVFLAPRSLWTSLLHSGFPSFADPQFQLWYPLNRLFALFPHGWEAFTLSAYVLASSFTYGYVYSLTKSRLAAVTSGAIYGMSGFMMAYWGYSTILHAVAWIPLLIWALEQLRDRLSGLWWLSGVVAVACMLLAGHPQIAVYGLALAVAYALIFGHTAAVGRWRYYRHCALMLVCAVGLTAVQLWPMLEFAERSVRAQMTFADFTSYSLLLPQLIQLCFPYYSPPKTNWLIGIFDYVGILVPMLAAVECLVVPRRGHTRFWLGVALVSFILALGSETPLSQIMYHVPIYNKFRAPVRTLIVANLAMGVLAGLAIARLQSDRIASRCLSQGALVGLAMLVTSCTMVVGLGLPPQIWRTLVLPIGLWTIGLALLIWQQQSRSQFRRQCLLLITVSTMVIDLFLFSWIDNRYPSGFGWLGYRSTPAQHRQYLIPSSTVTRYQQQLVKSHQRLLPIRGVQATYEGVLDDIPPNTSLFWGVPSASGYGPLILSRYQQLTTIDSLGVVSPSVLDPANRSLDILAVRYILANVVPPLRWLQREKVGASTVVYENSQVLPRTWLVPEVIPLPSAQVLSTIQTSRLPDGRIYEPRQMALVEDPKALFKPVGLQPTDEAKILKLEATRVTIQTQTAAPTFLVLSDVFYPGWEATIDGKPTPIYRTNYVQRGVQVPSGTHRVEYRFEPISFKLGAGITIAALCFSGYWVWRDRLVR